MGHFGTHFGTPFLQVLTGPAQDLPRITSNLTHFAQDREKGGQKRGQKRVKNGSKTMILGSKMAIFGPFLDHFLTPFWPLWPKLVRTAQKGGV